jgi:hypothetical protein
MRDKRLHEASVERNRDYYYACMSFVAGASRSKGALRLVDEISVPQRANANFLIGLPIIKTPNCSLHFGSRSPSPPALALSGLRTKCCRSGNSQGLLGGDVLPLYVDKGRDKGGYEPFTHPDLQALFEAHAYRHSSCR